MADNSSFVDGASNNKGCKFILERGYKFFELSNHLGNVLVTVTDRVLQYQYAGSPALYYEADVANANDYYPFGMMMVGRKYSGEKYRYGFNGKEKDDDINSLTAYDYGFRIYNPVIGKFLSVDPLFKSYPWYTPYQFAGNKPIIAIDIDGLEEKIVTITEVVDRDNKVLYTYRDVNESANNKYGLGKNGTMTIVSKQRAAEYNSETNSVEVYSKVKQFVLFDEGGFWNRVKQIFTGFRIGIVVFGRCEGNGCITGGEVGGTVRIIGTADLNQKETKELFEILDILGRSYDQQLDEMGKISLTDLTEKAVELVDQVSNVILDERTIQGNDNKVKKVAETKKKAYIVNLPDKVEGWRGNSRTVEKDSTKKAAKSTDPDTTYVQKYKLPSKQKANL